MTVLGPDPFDRPGIIDAHTHVWIDPVPGAEPGAPVLDDASAVAEELADFGARGGAAVIDCQPPGAGRDAERLVDLSRRSGVAVVASTGFHLDRYYAREHSPWHADPEQLRGRMVAELCDGLEAARGARLDARAGAIKAAHPGYLDDTVRGLFAAAADAANTAGVLLLVHTERGEGLEPLAEFLLEFPMRARNVILCHTDKRPDTGLHRTLAEAGFLLEYDTFMRSKYEPAQRLWPLLDSMLADGYGEAIACGLDSAGAPMWRHGGDRHGLRAWTDVIVPQMQARGYDEAQIAALTGGNVRARLTTSGAPEVAS
jgi:phosphotriesterase-related protein